MIAKVTSYNGEIIWDINKPDGPSQKILDRSISTADIELANKINMLKESGLI